MIINLTGTTVRVYGPDAPDVIEDDVLDLRCTVIPADVAPAHLHIDVLDSVTRTFHGGRPVEVYMVKHHVPDLPASRPGTYLLVDPTVGLCVRGRADLLIPFGPVHDSTGATVGYHHLVSPC
ncbi:hypothetical protein ABZ605_08460 [Streptomyces sp. NPDC012765]|uniref:hypothetical protein n=1 Tax=Streptomyces sp. NPDC012765 TaxID=3155249 RepID=UPI0033C7F8DD